VDLNGQLTALNRAVALERLGGDEELLREIAGLFLEDTQELVEEIRRAAYARDAAALQRAAHTLKGSVGNFGAEGTFEAAYQLEKMGRSGDLTGVEDAVLRLGAELDRLTPALTAIRSEAS